MATEGELQAQAEGGQAGLDAYNRAASEINARRAESIAGAMEGTNNRAAGAAADAAVQQIINAPVNRRLDDINQASATFSADMSRLQNAQSAYMAGARQFGSRAAIQQREQAARESRLRAIEDSLFNRYGGYDTSGEYENAVTAGAQALRDQTYADTKASYTNADRENDRQAASYAAQSAQYATRKRLEAQGNGMDLAAAKAASKALSANRSAVRGGGYRLSPAELEQQRQAASYTAQAIAAQERENARIQAARAQAAQAASAARPAWEGDALGASNEFEAQRASRLAALRQLVGQDMSLYAGRGPAQADPFARADGYSGGSIMDPRNLYEFQRDFAINELGADPLEAFGRFAPMSDLEAMEFEMDQADLRQQFLEAQQYGPDGRDSYLEQLVAQRSGMDLGQSSSATNLDPERVAAAVETDDFLAGLNHLLDPNLSDGDRADFVDSLRDSDGEAPPDLVMAAIFEEILASLFPDADY